MAGNMAWKAGKGAFQKFGGKRTDQDPTIRSVDHTHYRGAKIKSKKENKQLVFLVDDHDIANDHRKDSAYYGYLGIPEKDAKILSSVVSSARFLDNGMRLGPYKIGANTIIGMVPELGDFVGSLLSLGLVVVPAWQVSKRSDQKSSDRKKIRVLLVRNLVTGFVVGLLPVGGDIFDTMMKLNVKSASALEAMLLKRADETKRLGRDAEKVGTTTGHQHADTNGHHLTATNGYHNSEAPAHQPQRYITANDLRRDPSPAASERAPLVETQPKKSGGNFFRRRGGPQGGQEVGTTTEEVAPVRPPRPKQSTHERGGHF